MSFCVSCNEREVYRGCQKWKLCARCYKYLIQYLPYRIKVFDLLGWICACCGNNHIFSLVADHKNPNNKIKEGGTSDLQTPYLYRRILGDPKAKEHYQTLCWACNNSKKRNLKCRLNHSLKNRNDLVSYFKAFNFPAFNSKYKVDL